INLVKKVIVYGKTEKKHSCVCRADASKLLTRYKVVKHHKGLKRSGRPFLPEPENKKVRQEIGRRRQ
ncbi:hypothetical protein, partial [Streptococcus sobrinus]|uniref:hypothetical protein n=1 Tax=Streptococcus sobrinus TaxID=1310 RepID=UPI001C3F86A6